MKLIFDGNSLLNEALLRGVDKEFGRVVKDAEGKEVQVNSAGYGFEGFFDKFKDALDHFMAAPRQAVVVWDGANAKHRRRTFLPGYKGGRDKIPEVNEQLNEARRRVTEALYHLGAMTVYQDGLEADDVIGYLVKHLRYERNVIVTSDGDLSVLHDENTDVWRKGELNVNPCGPFPHKYITLYKAVVGDPSDKIPGANKFGDGAFVDFVRMFGLEGLDELQRMIVEGELDQLKDSLEDFPRLKLIIDGKDQVTNCWRVASLLSHEVNTLRKPLRIRPGMCTVFSEVPEDYRAYDLKRFYATKTLVTASNYAAVRARFEAAVSESPFVALDIESAEGPESEEWMEQVRSAMPDYSRIDVLGHKLAGMSLTFGENTQHTIYMSVDHRDTENITVDQCREMVELVPSSRMHIVIQNRSFELPVLYRTWGHHWMGNGWHGMVPNAIDSKIGASYVDENIPKGLKERSKLHLDYTQQTFEEVTTLSGPMRDDPEEPDGLLSTLPPGGRLKRTYNKLVKDAVVEHVQIDEAGNTELVELEPAVFEVWEERQYKMNELTAEHVFDYGCDDTICTASLHTLYKFVMELEQTWHVYLEVEQLPEYLTALAFVKGIPVSLAKLRDMEAKDEERYDQAWSVLRDYLMRSGWAGTVCPEFEAPLEPADVKLATQVLVDEEFSTRKSKMAAMAMDIRQKYPDNALAQVLAQAVESSDVDAINKLLKYNFTGDPKINFDSPKQMQNLFYRVIGIRPRIFNSMTQNQRDNNDVMSEAFKKLRRAKDLKVDLFTLTETTEGKNKLGRQVKLEPLTTEEYDALISKASTDDEAVAWALGRDELSEDQRAVLKAFETVKSVGTRRKLFYKTYKALPHWRDGRVHPSLNQSEAVTRRYSSSGPNVQQLPKLGDGVEFREIILPHCKDAVVVSLDFSAQELRNIAEWSGDENLTACYVGDNLKDVHGLTAAAASQYLWEAEVSYEAFMAQLGGPDKTLAKTAKDLRTKAKTVNFGTNYDQQAPALAQQLLVDEETAQAFIDAKDLAMPGINRWKEAVRKEVEEVGYATTMLGARRHLRGALLSDNRWEASKAGRQGPNFKIQSSCAEQTKLAMAGMWADAIFTDGRFNAEFYAPIHDEVVFSVHRDHAVECIQAVHRRMVQPYGGMKIPIISSISLGRNFGEQIELGEEPTREAIEAALAKALGA